MGKKRGNFFYFPITKEIIPNYIDISRRDLVERDFP